MNHPFRATLAVAVAAALAAAPSTAPAQALDRLVSGAPDGTVQFHFAAREGVCGNGRNFYRASEMGYYSSYSNGMDGTTTTVPRVRYAR